MVASARLQCGDLAAKLSQIERDHKCLVSTGNQLGEEKKHAEARVAKAAEALRVAQEDAAAVVKAHTDQMDKIQAVKKQMNALAVHQATANMKLRALTSDPSADGQQPVLKAAKV